MINAIDQAIAALEQLKIEAGNAKTHAARRAVCVRGFEVGADMNVHLAEITAYEAGQKLSRHDRDALRANDALVEALAGSDHAMVVKADSASRVDPNNGLGTYATHNGHVA